jgi:hypothetical protein
MDANKKARVFDELTPPAEARTLNQFEINAN